MGQIIGKMGVVEMRVGEMGVIQQYHVYKSQTLICY